MIFFIHCENLYVKFKHKNALKCHYCGFLSEILTQSGFMLESRKIGTSELCERLQNEIKDYEAFLRDELEIYKM